MGEAMNRTTEMLRRMNGEARIAVLAGMCSRRSLRFRMSLAAHQELLNAVADFNDGACVPADHLTFSGILCVPDPRMYSNFALERTEVIV